MLDVRRLRIFVVVADEGSFTAAAQKLYLTQSAVSQQMSVLEREIGVSLLERLPRGVRLTPAGQILADRARAVQSELLALEHQMRALRDGPQEIRVGAFGTAGVELLPVALRAFLRASPGTRVRLSTVRAADAAARLHDGDIQVLLTWDFNFAPRPADPTLTRIPLPDDPLRVVLPLDHPLAAAPSVRLADLAEEQWVVRAHSAPYGDAYQAMCRIAGFEPDIAFPADGYPAVLGLVAAGIGVSLVPAMSLVPGRPDVAVRRLESPDFRRQITILTLPDPSRSGPVEALLDALRDAAAQLTAEADRTT